MIKSVIVGLSFAVIQLIIVKFAFPFSGMGSNNMGTVIVRHIILTIAFFCSIFFIAKDYYFTYVNKDTLYKENKRFRANTIYDAVPLLRTVFVVMFIPVMILFWTVNRELGRKSINVALLALSSGAGIIYYYKNKKKFSNKGYAYLYFTGLLLGSVAVYNMPL